MDAAFAAIAFNEPLSAEANLALLETRFSPSLWRVLPTLLAQVPSPDDALNFLERYLREAPASVTRHLDAHPPALLYLLALFSHSRFLSESLVQQPELILWFDRRGPREGIQRMKSRDELTEEYYRFATMAFDLPPAVVLARFKRREYLRITLRDVMGIATLAETTLELSDLADVLIERALRLCAQRLENSFGAPQWRDAAGQLARARLTALALGKLGGQELNYSSDVDLMFLYDHDGETTGGASGQISNLEYFVRLAQAILKMLTETTPEGAVFRIDLRLRPDGQQGDLAISLASALDYYRTRAREWELQMLLKARVCAGAAQTGESFLREIHPLIFRRQFHLPALEAMLHAREGILQSLRSEAASQDAIASEWNVKLSPGGIRDIEFLAQCLQRLHGGRDPWLTGRGSGSTLVALQRLHDKAYLSQHDFNHLGSAYEFLRKVEHRLQLRDGLQEHTLPNRPGQLNRLARRCGIEATARASAGELLRVRVREHFENVRAIYDHALPAPPSGEAASEEPGRSAPAQSAPLLAAHALLLRLRQSFPALADFLEQLRSQGNAYARRGLERFLESASLDEALLQELDEHHDWLERAAQLCARSDLATEMLAREPGAIHQLAQTETMRALELPFPATMPSLRNRHRAELLKIISRSALGETRPFQSFAVLTRLAEEDLRGALEFAVREELPESSAQASPFAVIALGRLGSHEFDLGSDADLFFLVDATASEEDKTKWRRIAERFLHVAGSYTQEGLLLPIDTRLRPRGGEGEIVQSAAYLLEYFEKEAEGWEVATYLKARPVAGNCELGANTLTGLRNVLLRRFSPAHGGNVDELRQQLLHMRKRLEEERPEGPTGFKTSPGGYFDVDYITAFVTLQSGITDYKASDILSQLGKLESAGALDSASAATLKEAALFYRCLDHAIRLVLGRAMNHLPEPAQISRVVALLRQWNMPISAALQYKLDSTRGMVRGIYHATMGVRGG
jgi:[glutamine synthetase] adenylyltransferase / [glutamine synthetase]-adenylyl-L-tyrosine phosphorylase